MEIQIPTNFGKRYTQLFTDSYSQVAKQFDVPLLPFFLEEIALKPEFMQKDGIHPNAKAQPLISEHMQQALSPLLWSN